MKISAYLPIGGWFHYSANTVEEELATLRQKYPDVADQIIVRESKPPKFSDEEIKAMEAGNDD